jgi:hypothetical protein
MADRSFVQTKKGELIRLCANWKEEAHLNHALRQYRVESAVLGESYGYQEEDDKGFKEH